MRLRVTLVTPIFPIPAQPYRGRSEYEIVLALSKRADVNVICPSIFQLHRQVLANLLEQLKSRSLH